jgi:hypothetical protein
LEHESSFLSTDAKKPRNAGAKKKGSSPLLQRPTYHLALIPGTSGHDQTVYLVINNFGNLGTAFSETDVDKADLETLIGDLMSGQYSDPVRVVAFNTAEHWAEDVSEDVAREIIRRLDLAGREMPSSLQAFVDSHLGPDRQLTLRLA